MCMYNCLYYCMFNCMHNCMYVCRGSVDGIVWFMLHDFKYLTPVQRVESVDSNAEVCTVCMYVKCMYVCMYVYVCTVCI